MVSVLLVMRFVLVNLLMAAGIWLSVASEPAASIADLRKLEEKVTKVSQKGMPATVALVSEETGSSGSGVIVSADGLILTAAHVVQGMERVDVLFADGKRWGGKVLGANLSKDIGMVRMDKAGPWPFVELGKSKPLKAGHWVVAMGHSTGFDPARTPPVRFGRVMSDGPGNYFTTNATLIGGDSGGPIFDLDAKLVGVNSSIGQSWNNNNHAGIDGFLTDWERLLAGETWGALQMNPLDNPETPVVGIEFAIQRGVGAFVSGVKAGSPAAQAGIRRGDQILKIDGREIESNRGVQTLIQKKEVGDKVDFELLRAGESVFLEVTLANLGDVYKLR